MSQLRAAVLLLVLGSNICLTSPAQAGTTVGGVIASDTTWTMADSPYLVTSTVQIPEGVSLTIEPGAQVEGQSGVEEMFLVHGTLSAVGTSEAKVSFDGGGSASFFSSESAPDDMLVEIEYAEIHNGRSLWPPTGDAQSGQLILRHSAISDLTYYSYIWYPQKDFFIEYNTFADAMGFSIGHGAGEASDVTVYIRRNRFMRMGTGYSEYPAWVTNWAAYSNSMTVVSENVFGEIRSGQYALYLPPGYDSAAMEGRNNYWGTTDTSVISQRIFDQNDDIRVAGTIPFQPVLSTPHSEVPPEPQEPQTSEYQSITSLVLKRHIVAGARVTFIDGRRGECRIRTGIIQRRGRDGRWVKVQEFDGPSGDSYTLRLPDRPGRYRAKSILFSTSQLDICRGSTSPVVVHRH